MQQKIEMKIINLECYWLNSYDMYYLRHHMCHCSHWQIFFSKTKINESDHNTLLILQKYDYYLLFAVFLMLRNALNAFTCVSISGLSKYRWKTHSHIRCRICQHCDCGCQRHLDFNEKLIRIDIKWFNFCAHITHTIRTVRMEHHIANRFIISCCCR